MKLWLILFVVLLVPFVLANAKIEGAIYDAQLEPIAKVVISINTTPEQMKVSHDGYYQFIVPTGNYEMVVSATRNGTIKEIARSNVTVFDNGSYTKDLYVPDGKLQFSSPVTVVAPAYIVYLPYILTAVLILGIVLGYNLFTKHKEKLPTPVKPAVFKKVRKIKQKIVKIDQAHLRVLQIITANQGKYTQKQLRKDFACSEAKMSLIISAMEKDQLIIRKKDGRSNMLSIGPAVKEKGIDLTTNN
jgi:uncharacterized membrane protein